MKKVQITLQNVFDQARNLSQHADNLREYVKWSTATLWGFGILSATSASLFVFENKAKAIDMPLLFLIAYTIIWAAILEYAEWFSAYFGLKFGLSNRFYRLGLFFIPLYLWVKWLSFSFTLGGADQIAISQIKKGNEYGASERIELMEKFDSQISAIGNDIADIEKELANSRKKLLEYSTQNKYKIWSQSAKKLTLQPQIEDACNQLKSSIASMESTLVSKNLQNQNRINALEMSKIRALEAYDKHNEEVKAEYDGKIARANVGNWIFILVIELGKLTLVLFNALIGAASPAKINEKEASREADFMILQMHEENFDNPTPIYSLRKMATIVEEKYPLKLSGKIVKDKIAKMHKDGLTDYDLSIYGKKTT